MRRYLAQRRSRGHYYSEPLEARRMLAAVTWRQTSQLLANDGAPGDWFGYSVALAGQKAIVDSYLDDDDTGSTYVFDTNSGSQLLRLQPADAIGGGRFGVSIAVSGNRVIIGCPRDDDRGAESGSVYVFDLTTGVELLKLTAPDGTAGDNFGVSVAAEGDLVMIGADLDDDLGPNSGSAYVFDLSTGAMLTKLLPGDGSAGDNFGYAVAIDDNQAVVGSFLDDTTAMDAGSAYLFSATTGAELFKLTSASASEDDQFGISVALSSGVALIGSPGYQDNGSALLFDAATGAQLARLRANDGEPGDYYGRSVFLDGGRALIGAMWDDDHGVNSGSAYLFDVATRDQLAKISPHQVQADDNFSWSVALSGDSALVGSFFDDDLGTDSGSAFLFKLNDPPILAGPIRNPANGHDYYVLGQSNWTTAESAAMGLGGHLATINDSAEDGWVSSVFGAYDLWIGLNDRLAEGDFVYTSGEVSTYRNWSPSEPNNLGGEDFVVKVRTALGAEGTWNDLPDVDTWQTVQALRGLVEVVPPPSTQESILSGTAEILARGVGYSSQARQTPLDYPGINPADYFVDEVFTHGSGFYAIGLTSERFGPALVLRGTELSQPADVLDDTNPVGVGYEQFTETWPRIGSWLQNTRATKGTVDIVGHSLGGALVQWIASDWTESYDPPSGQSLLIDELVTFNSPGISALHANRFQRAEAEQVVHYIVNGDLVSMAGTRFINGEVRLASFADLNLLNKHTLPLTLPIIVKLQAGTPGYYSICRPAGLTFSSTPLTYLQLSSAGYGHSDSDYRAWLAGMTMLGGVSTAIPVVGLPMGVTSAGLAQLLRTRGGTETLRKTVGVGPYVMANMAKNVISAIRVSAAIGNAVQTKVVGTASKLITGLALAIDRGITFSTNNTVPLTSRVTGGMSLKVGDEAMIQLPGYLGGARHIDHIVNLAAMDNSATLTSESLSLAGTFSVLGGLIAVEGAGVLNWSRGELSLGGSASILGGFIQATGALTVSRDNGIQMGGSAAIRIPDGFGRLIGGKTLTGGGFKVSYSADGNFANDFIAGWGTLGGISFGVRFTLDGNADLLGAKSIAALSSAMSRSTLSGPLYSIDPGTEWAILGTEWSVPSTTARLSLLTPAGILLDEDDILLDPMIELVAELTSPNSSAVRINNPSSGTWRLILDSEEDPGTATFTAMSSVQPAPEVASVAASGGLRREPVSISVALGGVTPTTRVALYVDADGTGDDGVLIAANLIPDAGVVDYTWAPLSAPAGSNHVYAVVSSDLHAPVTAYAPAGVMISEPPPAVAAVTFDAERGNRITIDFTQNVSATFAADDLSLTNLTTGLSYPPEQLAVAFNALTNRATITVTGVSNSGIANVLPDGVYVVNVLAGGIVNQSGEPMASDASEVFTHMVGDANGDASVNFSDLLILAQNYGLEGRSVSQGNLDYSADGVVTFSDLLLLAQRYGQSLSLPTERTTAEPKRKRGIGSITLD